MAQQAVGNIPILTRRVRLGDFTVPAASGRDIINIDTARNVHAVYLYCTVAGTAATYAEMVAEIGAIRVRLGGKLIYDLTATQILDLYHYFNDRTSVVLTDAGVLPIVFTPMMLPLTRETQQYAIGMLSDADRSKRNTLTVEVNMTAGPITIDACEVHLETDDEPADTVGYHCRWLPYGTTWAAASLQTLDQITHESNALAVLGYHVHHAAGTLTRFALNVNDYDVISDCPRNLWLQQLNKAQRSPVATYEHIDFTLGGDPKAFLDISRLVNEYLRLTWGVAPTGYNVLVHQLCKNLN
jgi:hypothetical protein